jgi:uncharacterized protein (TIGR03435 family)
VPPGPPILNAPDWLDTDRFDIVGLARGNTTEGRAGEAALALMIRSVLASRFGLHLQGEVRPLPVYDLSLLKDDRTWGPRLRRATVDCLAPLSTLDAGWPPGGSRRRRDSCRTQGGDGYLRSGAMTMTQLAWMLSNRLRTVVRDRTGLVGPFKVDLAWSLSQKPSGATEAASQGSSSLHGSPMIEALREQLGLRVEPGTGPVNALVITKVSRDAIE